MDNLIVKGNLNKLSNKEFETLSGIIYENFGIKMPLSKKTMLECRLQRRLKSLDIKNFKDYIKFLHDGNIEKELLPMANEVTTNKTDFFREPGHFDFLKTYPWRDKLTNDTIKVWSSACSTGEEPYTLAMVLMEMGIRDFKILATDLSLQALQKAVEAIYPLDRVNPVPMNYKKKYLLKSKNSEKMLVRVAREVRKKVAFQHINLMDGKWNINHKMDIIFCRNVLIYFDRKTQEDVIRKLLNHLKVGGFLFIGHSESLSDLKLPLQQIKSTVYRKLEE